MATQNDNYPAKFDVQYSAKHDRLSTLFRLILSIPIVIILSLLTSSGSEDYSLMAANENSSNFGGITAGLFAATILMIVFMQRYPRWWFDFALELNRFSARVGAYFLLLTDRYPSTEDQQGVKLELEYPNVERDLNRWLPLVKWILAIPHYVALLVLFVAAGVATVVAWFAIIVTGRYPRDLFDFVVGVGRWSLRVNAYAFLLTTDKYPPFTLK